MDEAQDLAARLEDELTRVPGIVSAKVLTDADGTLREVHVVTGSAKAPKQVVRDVVTVAAARFGMEVDHRIVSVVQLGGVVGGGRPDPDSSPLVIEAVTGTHRSGRFRVEVVVSRAGRRSVGGANCRDIPAARLRAVAAAALESVAGVVGVADADVDGAAVVTQGGRDVAVVTVSSPSADAVGAAVVAEPGVEVAVAEATADAFRRLPAPAPLEDGGASDHTW